jgi:peptidoglycan/LPS O-acetylase OafA/YrhL
LARAAPRVIPFRGFVAAAGGSAGWPIAGLAILIGEALPALGGKNIFYYSFFVLGYLAMCSGGFMEGARRYRGLTLGLGMLASAWWSATANWRDALPNPSVSLFLAVLVGTTAGWMVIVGLLGTGRRVLNRPSRALGYLGEASYPVNILHQTVIVVLAFYVIDLAMPWGALWAMLLVRSVAFTFLLYEGVRRVGWLRTLFGMRPRPEQRPAIPVSARSGTRHPVG